MFGTEDQDEFVERCVIAILTTLRAHGSPASSMVSFARRADRLFFTTTLDRVKGRSLVRDPRCTVTVINQREPWSFVAVEGHVVVHFDNPPELRQLILGLVH